MATKIHVLRATRRFYGFDHAWEGLSMMSVRKSAGAGSFDKLHAGCDAPLMASSIRPIPPVNQLSREMQVHRAAYAWCATENPPIKRIDFLMTTLIGVSRCRDVDPVHVLVLWLFCPPSHISRKACLRLIRPTVSSFRASPSE
jgi:hypothetical protein